MQKLLIIKEQDIVPGAPVVDGTNFAKREAARAVIQDENGSVYLLKVGKHDYHKLPGGGIDDGENIQAALARELMEEIGCKAEIKSEVGIIVEYRDQSKLTQTSYCYLAKQVGEQGDSSLEADEIAEGLHEVKVKNIDEAINLLENDVPNNYVGRFIRLRDLTLLKAAKQLLET